MKQKIKILDAKKKKDGWWASVFSGPIANFLLNFIAEIKWITPNCVTNSSLFFDSNTNPISGQLDNSLILTEPF